MCSVFGAGGGFGVGLEGNIKLQLCLSTQSHCRSVWWEKSYSSSHSQIRPWVEISGQRHAPAALPSGKNPAIKGIGVWVGHKADTLEKTEFLVPARKAVNTDDSIEEEIKERTAAGNRAYHFFLTFC